ncbi:hypothetical protein ACNQFZ_16060 [Schinkia sp. CFF1]
MNEKGSSLLVVMLISLIFCVLGLAVLGASVNNAKRAEIRETEIETTSSEKVLMSEVVAKLQDNLNNTVIEEELKKNQVPSSVYNSQVNQAISNTASAFTGVTISENEENYKKYGITDVNLFKDNNFLRIYEIKIDHSGVDSGNPTIKRTITENVVLSPTPSFLNFAVGAYGMQSGTTNTPIQVNDVLGVNDKGQEILRESDNSLIINGSPDIIGNVFAPTLELNSKAIYKNTNESEEPFKTGPFQGPSIFGTLYTTKLDNKRKTETGLEETLKKPFYEGKFKEAADGIIGIPAIKGIGSNFVDLDFDSTFKLKWTESTAPVLVQHPDKTWSPEFSDLTCSDPFYQALINTDGLVENHDPNGTTGEINDSGYDPLPDLLKIAESDEEIRSGDLSNPRRNNPIFYCGKKDNKQVYLLEESMLETYKDNNDKLLENYMDTDNIASKLIFFTNIDKDKENGYIHTLKNNHTLTINKSLDLKDESTQEKGWLVVNGSLEINGGDTETDAPIIKGNILVNGDLYIRSKNAELDTDPKQYLKFDATIYVTGNSTIDNVNISGAKDYPEAEDKKQLVLISKGDLKIVRINEYEDVDNDDELLNVINKDPNLKAFFYTDKNATLYGVGSNFQIEGGIFAREQLTINAIRYNFSSQAKGSISEISSTTDSKLFPNLRSRFYTEYDNKVITDQLSSLPRVNRLQVIVDNQVIH